IKDDVTFTTVFPGNGCEGVSTMVLPDTASVAAKTTPVAVPIDNDLADKGLMASLYVRVTVDDTGTPVAPSDGLTVVARGAVVSSVALDLVVNDVVSGGQR